MSRRPKPSKSTPKASNALLEAVLFVGSILKDSGTIGETHIVLRNNYIIAFNGVLATGIEYKHDFFTASNYVLLEKALSRCQGEYLVEATADTLIIKSGKFKAIVPCIHPDQIYVNNIDTEITSINEELKKGLETVLPLVSETGQTIYNVSILLNGQSVIACENGVLILEYWHGNDMPAGIAIPKSLAVTLAKSTKKLKGFGFNDTTITFYFEDNSWLRSQLFKEQWPDIGKILNVSANTFEIPKDLYEGLASIAPHSIDGLCYFDSGYIRSSNNENFGASFEVKGLPKGPVFNIKQLMLVKDYMKQVDFFCEGGKFTYFQGDKVRGVIAGRSK